MNELAPLWQIEDELAALVDSLDTCPPELHAELEQRIAAYIGAEVEKVDRIAGVLASLEGVQANAKAEIERLRQRQQTAKKAGARLEGYLLQVIRQRDGRPLRGRNTTFSIRRSESLEITDPLLIPDQWKRITVVTDIPKIPIKEAIKAGQQVPGAHIEQHENLVRK